MNSNNVSIGLTAMTDLPFMWKRCLGFAHVMIAFVFLVLITGTIFGNVVVILAICMYRRMRTFTNFLLMSLATADLFVGLLIEPLAMIFLLNGQWPLSQLVCKIWATLDVLLCTASILSLCIISVDRYFAIAWPLVYLRRRNKRTAAGVVTGAWAVSLVICAPPWLGIGTWGFTVDHHNCGYVKEISYRIYSAFGSFFIPLFVMLFVYSRIFKVTVGREKALNLNRTSSMQIKVHRGKKKKKSNLSSMLEPTASALMIAGTFGKQSVGLHAVPDSLFAATHTVISKTLIHQRSMSSRLNVCDNASLVCDDWDSLDSSHKYSDASFPDRSPTVSDPPDFLDLRRSRSFASRSANAAQDKKPQLQQQQQQQKERRSSKEKNQYLKEQKALKTIAMVVCGFVVCWFPFFLSYILESACPASCHIPPDLMTVFLWLGYSNSVINPLIYAMRNRDFRRCFKDLLTCGCCRKSTDRSLSIRRLHQTRM